MIPASLWTAIVTLMIGGNLRGKHKIMAPAIGGHPEFDRAYRGKRLIGAMSSGLCSMVLFLVAAAGAVRACLAAS